MALLDLEIPTLADAWLAQLQELSRALLGRDHQSGDNLVRMVHAVSQAYIEQRSQLAALRGQGPMLSARLQFFLPRDQLKVHGPLAELASVDALPNPKEMLLRERDYCHERALCATPSRWRAWPHVPACAIAISHTAI